MICRYLGVFFHGSLVLFIGILLTNETAFGDGTPIDTGIGGGSAIDMLQQKKTPFDSNQGSGEVRLYTTCTSQDGTVYQKDDAGYDRCIEQVSNQKTNPVKINGELPGNQKTDSKTDSKKGSTLGAGFKVGK